MHQQQSGLSLNLHSTLSALQGLLWETSLLDPEEGIRFRGHSIPELQVPCHTVSGLSAGLRIHHFTPMPMNRASKPQQGFCFSIPFAAPPASEM